LVADYALYPRLARVGGTSFNSGENGLWLRYGWYFGQHSDAELRTLARQLTERQIRYAYFHVPHITPDGPLRYPYSERPRRLVAAIHREAPSTKVIAWVFAGNQRVADTGVGEVDLGDAAVRRRMVTEARWLVSDGSFDGVQWDYEICDDGNPYFLALLRETRA